MTQPKRQRVDSIDWLRGLVMVLMALDHVRDFVGPTAALPEDLDDPGLAWFLTRWVTHFCAPVFVLLAGVSAWLYGSRGRSRGELARFLLARGAWLTVLELTVVGVAWTFAAPFPVIMLQVIWAIGMGMVVLAGLLWLPRPVIAAVALAMIAGHNLLDSLPIEAHVASTPPNALTGPDKAYAVLHVGQVFFPLGSLFVLNIYPLIPWVALLAVGYAAGAVMQLDRDRRARALLIVGAATTAGFVVLRTLGAYGDPRVAAAGQGIVEFLNTEKYPPSLQFLLMTLGPALLMLGWLDRRESLPAMTRWLVTFGRVPLFFYVVHIALANALGAIYFKLAYGIDRWQWAIQGPPGGDYVPSLLAVYLAWVAVVALLYRPCRWFASRKAAGRGWWWSYL